MNVGVEVVCVKKRVVLKKPNKTVCLSVIVDSSSWKHCQHSDDKQTQHALRDRICRSIGVCVCVCVHENVEFCINDYLCKPGLVLLTSTSYVKLILTTCEFPFVKLT